MRNPLRLLPVLVLACSGTTNDVSDVTTTSARLNGTGTCDSGSCEIFFKYWREGDGESAALMTPTRTLTGLPLDFTSDYNEVVQGLQPDTLYQYRFCGRESTDASFICAQVSTFRTVATSAPAVTSGCPAGDPTFPDPDMGAYLTPIQNAYGGDWHYVAWMWRN